MSVEPPSILPNLEKKYEKSLATFAPATAPARFYWNRFCGERFAKAEYRNDD